MFAPVGLVTIIDPVVVMQSGCVVVNTGDVGTDGAALILIADEPEVHVEVVFFATIL